MKVDWKIRTNIWVSLCTLFIFMHVSVEIDSEALNCVPLSVNKESFFIIGNLITLFELELAFETSV